MLPSSKFLLLSLLIYFTKCKKEEMNEIFITSRVLKNDEWIVSRTSGNDTIHLRLTNQGISSLKSSSWALTFIDPIYSMFSRLAFSFNQFL